MKTELMQFGNEVNATLKFGDHEIAMSYTFIHFLSGVLAMGRTPTDEPYPREMDAFQNALSRLEEAMCRTRTKHTPQQKELMLDRYHRFGRGYWSSWMDEPCPWVADSQCANKD